MSLVLLADPFALFPRQVQNVDLIQLPNSPGLEEKLLARQVKAIVKQQTSSDSPAEYESRNATRRIHLKADDLPYELYVSPDRLIDIIVKLEGLGARLKITDVSFGQDMDKGLGDGNLRFVTVYARPWSNDSL